MTENSRAVTLGDSDLRRLTRHCRLDVHQADNHDKQRCDQERVNDNKLSGQIFHEIPR